MIIRKFRHERFSTTKNRRWPSRQNGDAAHEGKRASLVYRPPYFFVRADVPAPGALLRLLLAGVDRHQRRHMIEYVAHPVQPKDASNRLAPGRERRLSACIVALSFIPPFCFLPPPRRFPRVPNGFSKKREPAIKPDRISILSAFAFSTFLRPCPPRRSPPATSRSRGPTRTSDDTLGTGADHGESSVKDSLLAPYSAPH